MALMEVIRSAARPQPTADLPFDEMATIISNDRRRHIIQILDHGPSDISTLSETIAEREVGPNYGTQDRKRVYVSLHQTHLEKLAHVGIVIRERQDVRPGRNHAAAMAAIQSLDDYVRGNGA